MSTTRGVLHILSAPSALCPHIGWAVGGVFGMRVNLDWKRQPAERSAYQAELSWEAEAGTAAKIASALRGWQQLRFEVTEDPTATSEGERYCYTPSLGVFHAHTGLNGDIMIPETQIKTALVADALGKKPLAEALDELLGKAWDDELDIFRYASEGVPVRWLSQVV